jgi:serine phosphatase RsbU (regulator of sigma subunit)
VDWRFTTPADDVTRTAVETLKSKAWLALPLRDPNGGTLGALRFSRGRDEPPFDEDDAALAREVTDLCGTAISRSQTAHGHRVALESLTRDLAPNPLPTIPGLELGVRYHSGTSEVGVGGDWCDAVLVNGRVVLAVGDAAGHGISAAVTMNEAASALRAFAFVEPSNRVVRNLDRYMATRRTAEMVTACVIDLDLQTRRMKIANAGHMPPILASSRTTKYLDKGRTAPLGSGKASGRLRPGRVRLQTGDRLYLYTDGLVERRGEVIDIGIDRLVRTVVSAPDDVGESCDHILAKMAPPGGFTDDVALLAVKMLRGAEPS